MKYFLKNNGQFLIVLILAAVLRILVSPFGNNSDLLAHAGWGDWIYQNGPKGFYENNIWIYAWPTQLPFINLIYGFNYYLFEEKLLWHFSYISEVIKNHNIFPQYFNWWSVYTKWFGTELFLDTPFRNGFIVSMKIIPVVSDIMIGILIYLVGLKISTKKMALIISSLFLLLPFSWYVSSVWAQEDQLATMFILAAAILLSKRFFLLSTILLVLGWQAKPNHLFILPIFGLFFLLKKPSLLNIALSIVTAVGIFYLTSVPFIDGNILIYYQEQILPKVFNSDRYGLVNHAFNFWQLLAPFGGWSTTFNLLGIPALFWGIISILLFVGWSSLIIYKEHNFKSLLMGLYLVSAGSYLFGTGMVDRYFFSAVVFLGILTFYFKNIFWIWIFTCLLFSLNLFYTWGYPILSDLTAWKSEILIRAGSLLQVAVFIWAVGSMNYLSYLKSFLKILKRT